MHGNGALEMVDRILSMLSQFLISNQSLEIDNSFRVYVKILSIDHMAIKAKENRKHTKRTKHYFQRKKQNTHFGASDSKKE